MMTVFMKHGQTNASSKCKRPDNTHSVAPRLPVLLSLEQAIPDHTDGKEMRHVD